MALTQFIRQCLRPDSVSSSHRDAHASTGEIATNKPTKRTVPADGQHAVHAFSLTPRELATRITQLQYSPIVGPVAHSICQGTAVKPPAESSNPKPNTP